MAVGCEKQVEIGEVIFCTNAYIGNCAFSMQISVDGKIVGKLTAESGYSSMNCKCPEDLLQGTIVNIETGLHTYEVRELECVADNRINEWSGFINVNNDNCETVRLDVTE